MVNFINPIKGGYLTSSFGWRMVNRNDGKGLVKNNHQGIDLSRKPNTNVDILASADGEVIRVGALGTYGNIVIIKHTVNGKRMDTNYAHLKNNSTTVKVGQKVNQGQKIGVMGGTGGNFAPHLHFEIHNGAWLSGQPNAVDPLKYFKLTDEVASKLEIIKIEEELTMKQYEELKKDIEELKKLLKNKSDLEVKNSAPDSWAKTGWDWGKHPDNKITDGTNPHGAVTRQQLVTMLYRLYNLIVAKLGKK